MRFIEFADPKPYTVSVDDADDFLDQLEKIWPENDAGTNTSGRKSRLVWGIPESAEL